MLGEIFYWIFNMSIVASVMGLIVLAIRKARFIPHRVSVFLWIIPFFRMCIPFGLNSRYSLMTLISKFTTRTVPVYSPAESLELSYINTVMAADSYSPVTYKSLLVEKVFSVASLIWMIVALALILTLLILYFTTIRTLRDARHLEGNTYTSDKIDGPAVYGIIRPRILLPSQLPEADRKYVILHEKTHIRRKDNLWRLLGFLIAAVHWYNPLSWIFLKVFLSDLELACDESATAEYDISDRKEYARALLNCTPRKNVFVSAFGGAKVRVRIENVLSRKPMTLFSTIGFTALVIAIIYVLLTNAG